MSLFIMIKKANFPFLYPKIYFGERKKKYGNSKLLNAVGNFDNQGHKRLLTQKHKCLFLSHYHLIIFRFVLKLLLRPTPHI